MDRDEMTRQPDATGGGVIARWSTALKRVATIAFTAMAIGALSGQNAWGGSETPPPGAPWQRKLQAVQQEALQTGKPIFVYFTKTY